MELNDKTKERIAEKIMSAMKREALMNKDVAEIFGGTPSDMSNVKNPKYLYKISAKIWQNMRAWYYSDSP